MKTKMSLLVVITVFLPSFPAVASVLTLNDALRATYTACVGIDDALFDLKKMAGINTAITAVGTAAGVGATVVGVIKAGKDADAKVIADTINYINNPPDMVIPESASWDAFLADFNAAEAEQNYKRLRDESKKLGNWRTGLMATGTVANVAGTIIAAKNKVDGDLDAQITVCKNSLSTLRTSIMQARINGEDVTEAQSIESACSEFEYVDLSKINTRGKGAMISSGVGVATGFAGTIASIAANSEQVRKDKVDMTAKTDEEWAKEKSLNMASNVLAGASAAASATAVVFNATQISAIKKVAEVASKCTGVLRP